MKGNCIMKKSGNIWVKCLVASLALSLAIPVNLSIAFAQDEATMNSNTALELRKTDIAQVFITASSEIVKEDYVPASISIVDKKNGTYKTLLDNEAKIKLRGNSTARLKKSPFNIKLSASQSVLGMPEGKKWCLLANYLDATLMRNKIAYDFAENIGLPYSCQTRYADVWLNGVYNGNYLITVPVDTGSNRVDVNTENNEYLLEIQRSKVEADTTYICSGIYRFQLGGPETITEDQKNYLSDLLVKAEAAMQSGDSEKVEEYIDFDTFIDFYIIQELFKNKDCNVSSTRFYIKNNKFYAGPLWDCDLSSGNVSEYPGYTDYLCYNNCGEYGNGSDKSYEGYWAITSTANLIGTSWIELLMNCDEFSEEFYERYQELQGKIENLYQDNSLGKNKMDLLLTEYKSSFNRDAVKWPVASYKGSELYRNDEKTYDESVTFLRSFLKNRNEWLLASLASYKPSNETPSVKATASAPQTAAMVLVNGSEISFETYNINGNNYFKLRDCSDF